MDNLNYGVIGNSKSAALVSESGSIDWCCLPDFNSPAVFAALLDQERGGKLAINVGDEYSISQSYIENTNILVTRFTNGTDIFEVVDFMPRYYFDNGSVHCPPDIVRYFRLISGKPKFSIIYDPKLMFGEKEHKTVLHDNFIKSYSTAGIYDSIYLYTDFNAEKILKSKQITLKNDQYIYISYNQKLISLTLDKVYLEYERTKIYWLNWSSKTVTFNEYNKEIIRSSLVLKLLTFQKTGAILAAVTTSLPETIGEVRNWDYRFCWIRDASMTISTLTAIGHRNDARRFLNFIVDIIPLKNERIQIMYGIRGEKKLTERIIPWLRGYENSKPVRVGNAAYMQKQNDIYGILIDIIYKYFRYFRNTLDYGEDLWTIVRSLVKTVRNNWRRTDMGIWEFRTQKQHFTFSKVLCWVALDRGVKLALLFGRTELVIEWAKERDAIKKDILTNGWNEELQSFTQAYNNENMDAAILLMANYGFIDPKDPKYVSTVLKIKERLCKNGLMYRYRNKDDFGEPTSSFTVCTFWIIKSLFLIGEKDEAKKMFKQLLSYSNHLGLFSEDIDFTSKRLLGNFPQAYSHLALIDTAMTLTEKKPDESEELLDMLDSVSQ